MRVLVSAASKHGATAEIADEIGATLELFNLDVDVRSPEKVTTVEDYDAVVLGSAVYTGHWMKASVELVERCAASLGDRALWLFSSGPLGDPPKPAEDPVDVAELVARTGAREHLVFTGALDPKKLGFAQRALVLALHAPSGDFRDWEDIRAWARQIAAELGKPQLGLETELLERRTEAS